MKKQLWAGLATGLMLGLAGLASAASITFTFSDQDYADGASWGTMIVNEVDPTTLSVRYDALSVTGYTDSQATGFAFGVETGHVLASMSNPDDGTFSWDNDDLEWILHGKKIGTLPTPANANEYQDEYFTFAATEDKNKNFTPPGIHPGQSDIFYLNFTSATSLANIDWTAVRLQAIMPGDESLFLIGGTPMTPVPEPATMLLLGTCLAGLAGMRRRKKA